MSARPEQSCYLCGGTHDLTMDHVPPENLFPTPKPSNLIKVPCCRPCNKSFDLDDDAFRVFASSVLGRSPAGARIWKEAVVGSSFKRSPKLRANVVKHLAKMTLKTARGNFEALGILIPEDRANRYLVRLTKGLIRHFDPSIDHAGARFQVAQLDPTRETIQYLIRTLPYDQRGERVFRFWRGMSKEGDTFGVWVYAFYDTVFFMVTIAGYKVRAEAAGALEKNQ